MDICQLETFVVAERGATDIYWVEVRDDVKHATMHRRDPHNKKKIIWPKIPVVSRLKD